MLPYARKGTENEKGTVTFNANLQLLPTKLLHPKVFRSFSTSPPGLEILVSQHISHGGHFTRKLQQGLFLVMVQQDGNRHSEPFNCGPLIEK